VVVALTEAGVARLNETVPAHLREVAQFDDEELTVLERALDKVALDCSFA
jgi:hypothetical protein